MYITKNNNNNILQIHAKQNDIFADQLHARNVGNCMPDIIDVEIYHTDILWTFL